ncbi:MAG: DcaP family trimeric outer membrane transporter [Xanthomonadales bacterium]|nr:DcaP family trimeric outer membrane transporter [Xanthomonadales bacterium]
MIRSRSKKATLVAAILACLPATAVADGSELDALRDRVVQLESLVRDLVADREQTRAELRRVEHESAAALDERIARTVAELREVEPETGDGITFGGYLKSDFILSDYSGGQIPSGSIGRDFYVPGTLPVGGADEDVHADFHARETRLFLKAQKTLENGSTLGAYVEGDFLVTGGGNERVSNSYSPRMRHAFVSYEGWLAGQTWTTFQNVGALAENLDFVGPAEGTVFGRQVMVRYTGGPWQFAIENPETTVTPFGGGARIASDDGNLPDFVARYEARGDWGNFVVTGLLRQLAYEDPALGIDDTETSIGLSLSGKMPVGRDDFRWMLTAGQGLGRYVGLNTANGAVLTETGELEAIDSISGFASYRHLWSDQWRSNATLSFIDVDNDIALTGAGVTAEARSLHLNLIYNPLPGFDLGVEYIYAERELESGADGDMNRLQFSTRFAF